MEKNQKVKIKGILFDKDGTLIEFEAFWHEVIKEVFLTLGDLFDLSSTTIKRLMDYSGVLENGFAKESLIQYQSTSQIATAWAPILLDASPLVRAKYGKNQEALASFLYEIIDEISRNTKITAVPMPFAGKVLKQLKEMGLFLGVATADTKSSTIKSLEETGLIGYFDFLGCDDGKTRPKPDPSLGLAFEKASHLKQGEYLMVGDSLSDYEFSKNCNIPFVGIRSSYSQLSTIKENIHLIESLEELIEVVCG